MAEPFTYITWDAMPVYHFRPETKLRLIPASYLRLFSDLCAAFTQRWGDQAWLLLDGMAKQTGRERAARLQGRLRGGESLAEVVHLARFEQEAAPSPHQEVKVLDSSPGRLREQRSGCGLLPACGRLPDLCERFFQVIDATTLRELGLPMKRFEVTQWSSRGAACEDVTYELADGQALRPGGAAAAPAQTPIDQVIWSAQQASLKLIADLIIAFSGSYGEQAWDLITQVGHRIGEERAPRLRERFKIDPQDARSLYQIFRFEEDLFYHTTLDDIKLLKMDRTGFVEHCFRCAHLEQCKRCPDMCFRLFWHIDVGTLEALGVKLKDLRFGKKLSRGDDFEETVLEIQ